MIVLCIVKIYYDVHQCRLKLFGFDHGVTVSLGLTIPVTNPSCRTAFDIAETNTANSELIINSSKIASKISQYRESI